MPYGFVETITLPNETVSELEDASTGSVYAGQVRDVAVQIGPMAHLRLDAPLARGGMGEVHKGFDLALKRPVAAKLLRTEVREDERVRERFLSEAELTASLEHPNIIPVHVLASRPDTGPFFTMKLVEGRTLLDHLRENVHQMHGDVLDSVIDIVIKICDALALAHSKGVAHLDLKAANILIGAYGEVYLTDWGIARRFPGPGLTTLDGRPAISGTPTMMAPEQAHGHAVDGRTDVFGVGALLYYILGRRGPYHEGDRRQRVKNARACSHPRLKRLAPNAPATLIRIIERAMQPDPDDRYPTISDLRDDLDRFRRGRLTVPERLVVAGECIIVEGDDSDEMFIVKEGVFEVFKMRDGQSLKVNTVGPGSILGEAGLLAEKERTATVRARTAGVVQVVSQERFRYEMRRIPEWLAHVMKTTGTRFHKSETQDELPADDIE